MRSRESQGEEDVLTKEKNDKKILIFTTTSDVFCVHLKKRTLTFILVSGNDLTPPFSFGEKNIYHPPTPGCN